MGAGVAGQARTTATTQTLKDVEIVLKSPERRYQRMSADSEIYEVSVSGNGMWHVQNRHADPLHAQELLDWVIDDVFAVGDGSGMHRERWRAVEFSS